MLFFYVCLSMLTKLLIYAILFNPFRHVHFVCMETKFNLNFYFHTCLWCLKTLYLAYIITET